MCFWIYLVYYKLSMLKMQNRETQDNKWIRFIIINWYAWVLIIWAFVEIVFKKISVSCKELERLRKGLRWRLKLRRWGWERG